MKKCLIHRRKNWNECQLDQTTQREEKEKKDNEIQRVVIMKIEEETSIPIITLNMNEINCSIKSEVVRLGLKKKTSIVLKKS